MSSGGGGVWVSLRWPGLEWVAYDESFEEGVSSWVWRRARRHVLEHHRGAVPAAPAAPPAGDRPVVVLEAPLLELSSSAVLTIETARALARRGAVDLRLVPVPPFERESGRSSPPRPAMIPPAAMPRPTTDPSRRRLVRSWFFGCSSPSRMKVRIAVGAV